MALRLKGNQHFASGNCAAAIECWRGALLACDAAQQHPVLPVECNQAVAAAVSASRRAWAAPPPRAPLCEPCGACLANMSLAAGNSVLDAAHAVILRPGWPKALYRLVSALQIAAQRSDACAAQLAICLELMDNVVVASRKPSDGAVCKLDAQFLAKRAELRAWHARRLDLLRAGSRQPTRSGDGVRVQWLSERRGKGVILDAVCESAGALVHTDAQPVVMAPKLAALNNPYIACYCALCLRSQLNRTEVGGGKSAPPLLKKLLGVMPSTSKAQPHWVRCDCGCDAQFCSLRCRDAAMRMGHLFLGNCPASPSADQPFWERIRALGRTSAYLASKMLVSVVVKDQAAENLDSSFALECSDRWQAMALFQHNLTQACDEDKELVSMLRAKLARRLGEFGEGAQRPPFSSLHSGWNSFLTVERFRRLVSVLSMNSQDVLPWSEVHEWINSNGDVWEQLSRDGHQLGELQALSLQGQALYPVLNLANHSCEPNVAIASVANGPQAAFVSLRPIARGEELVISYIDETLARAARQRRLAELYGFQCQCLKCKK